MASGALCASRQSRYPDFIAEVRSGWSRPLLTGVLPAVALEDDAAGAQLHRQYRKIARFRGEPIHAMLDGRLVLLDPVGRLARLMLRLTDRLGLSA